MYYQHPPFNISRSAPELAGRVQKLTGNEEKPTFEEVKVLDLIQKNIHYKPPAQKVVEVTPVSSATQHNH